MPETKRQLAAIMFTDIVGYTALMGKSSKKALELVRISKEIQKPLVKKYNGKWLKEMGDGALAQFSTALDAVNCAVEIQEHARAKFDGKLRIGVHLGDITIENDDVYGDGVNVASRLESIADPGGIYISDAILKAIQGQSDAQTKYLGEVKLKNVAYGVRTYALQGVGLPLPKEISNQVVKGRSISKSMFMTVSITVLVIMAIGLFLFLNSGKTRLVSGSTQDMIGINEISIAVLPFENMSGDSDQEMICDGLTEEIIHHLSVINIFDKVISRGSVMTFKDSEKTTPEIASLLDVNLILEGSYRQFGERIKITAQLIEASTDNHLWSEIYERPIGDIFDIQSDIAKNIASKLIGELSPGENYLIRRNRTDNVKAFELYQLGRFYWNKRTGEDYHLSLDYFRQAIEEDPEYGLAYAGMADSYNLMAVQGYIDKKEGRDKAVDLSKKALELDGQIAEAHNVLASIYTYIDRDWEAADQEYLKAIEINPNYPTVHHYYSEHLSLIGQHDQARQHINKALELDPLSFVIRYVSAKLYFHRGQFQEAQIDLQRCKELNHGEDHLWIAEYDFRINRELGNEQKAFDGFKRLYGNFAGLMEPKEMDSIYQDSGLNGLIERRIELSEFLWEKPGLYGILGNDEKALEWLEIAVNKGESHSEFPFQYEFRNLHSNPRYQALLRKIGLDDI